MKAEGIAVVFLATPPEVSMDLAPAMLAAGAKVVDLSGAFRLRTPERYAAWYKAEHTQPELLAEAAYGLPEFCREAIPGARLVSNPGCYPTAANPGDSASGGGGRSGPRGGHRVRCEIRRERRGTQAVPQDQLLRGRRKLLGVFHPEAPARA